MIKRKWDFESCKAEALKYNTITDFQKNCGSAYNKARKNNWAESICSHMQFFKYPKGYWSKNRCKTEAKKYSNSSDFMKGNPKAYDASVSKGWLKEITLHFIKKAEKHLRYIYAYEFSDNSVYVGLTCDIIDRKVKHKIEGSVFEHQQKTNLVPIFKLLLDKPLPSDDASIAEGDFLEKYKQEKWHALNKAKTGSLGGTITKWTKNMCLKEALKYTKRADFQKANGSAYQRASKNKWLDEICSHMLTKSVPKGFYTLEKCIKLASQCDTRKEFKAKYHHAHDLSYKNKWTEKVFKNFTEMRPRKNKNA